MATLNDIEQLCYLGMRLALRRTFGSSELREYAKLCARRRNDDLRRWIDNNNLPASVTIEGLDNLRDARELGRGAVVTSFQIGPFNWIPLILNERLGLETTLLVDEDNFIGENRRWANREVDYRGTLPEPIRLINSADPTATWKMVSSLRNRRTLIGWFDGMTGVSDGDGSKSIVTVNFFETMIRLRVGLAFISAKTGAPLVLAVTHNLPDGGISLGFARPLSRSAGESEMDFQQRAAQTLVSALEDELRRDLTCWDEWCHCHTRNCFEPSQDAAHAHDAWLSDVLVFDEEIFDLLSLSDGEVMVSLLTGVALASTPLLCSIRDAADGKRSGFEIVEALQARFGYHATVAALRELLVTCHMTPAAAGDDRQLSSQTGICVP